MKTIISIITPVYKAEKYIHRCVDSILAQTFADFELILIDDGSPDNSGAICDEYATKDPRVKVVHKENGGVSSARQCGIDKAVGEYTIHADADDWADPTMLQELYDKAIAENADIVVCDYYTHKKGRQRYVSQSHCSLEPDSLLKQYLRQELHGALWNKLIRRELYAKFNILFPQEIVRWEDLFVVCSMLLHPVKVAYLPKAFYHYDLSISSNSLVRRKSIRGLQSQIRFVNHFQEILPRETFADEIYIIKAATKELAYNTKLMEPNELMDLFGEINERYIESADQSNLRQLCFSRFLSGRYTYSQSKRVRRALNLLQKIRKIIKL